METVEIIKAIKSNYDIDATVVNEKKNIIKIQDSYGSYCFKKINYNFGHFLFIVGAMNHLQEQGFEFIPNLLFTNNGKQYIEINNGYGYLIPWIDARHSNYNDEFELKRVTEKLAEFHIKSRGFENKSIYNPRVGWSKWIEIFETRKNEMLDFKNRIEGKSEKGKFDTIFYSMLNKELARAEESIGNLKKSYYLQKMKKESELKSFCHHDMANHNVLVKENGDIYFIDFDYCILDTHLHDFASLLIRNMKHGNWNIKKTTKIMGWYDSVFPFEEGDVEIMAAFMEFPQDYWQRGIQYYWEEKDWGEEFFINKLTKYINDIEEKTEFLNQFRCKKLCQII